MSRHEHDYMMEFEGDSLDYQLRCACGDVAPDMATALARSQQSAAQRFDYTVGTTVIFILASIATVALVALLFSVVLANAEPLRIIKSVPDGATVEYRVHGEVVQSMPLAPGTYEITVRDLKQDGAIHGRPGRRH